MPAELIARARAGDGDAFRALTEPHRRELQVHCYRMLGSLQDAEDALQDTLLVRLARPRWVRGTRLDPHLALPDRHQPVPRRASLGPPTPAKEWDIAGVEPPEPTRLGEVVWLEPYPDALLEDAMGVPLGPEARYEQTESISLAFVTALQVLPPRQLAVRRLARRPRIPRRARWPTCSTRPSSRSTAPSSAPVPACRAAWRRAASIGLLPPPTHPPSRRSWPSSSAPTSPPISTRWWRC